MYQSMCQCPFSWRMGACQIIIVTYESMKAKSRAILLGAFLPTGALKMTIFSKQLFQIFQL